MAGTNDTLLDEVRRFVDDEALPAVAQYDRDDAYPEPLVERRRSSRRSRARGSRSPAS